MKLTIFGTGYVGLVTGTCLADVGHNVLCVDIDEQKVEALNRGEIPIYEPGLENLVEDNFNNGQLRFTSNVEEGVHYGDIIFVAVGTPPNEDGSADLRHVLSVAKTIGEYMQSPKVVVSKSTVPVGTCDKIRIAIKEQLSARGVDLDFDVVSNPEFLKEGAAVSDFKKPDRIVVGCESESVMAVMRELYAPFNRNHDRMVFMDVRSAELTKYAANAMLATKISFMNEIANIAELVGADIENVRHGIGSDTRIGYQFIYPGCGYGGSCFPKDVKALKRTADEIGYFAQVLEAVESVNVRQKSKLPDKVKQHFGENLEGKTFALWGLSFKPQTDDMREAASLILMDELWKAGASVQAYDPQSMQETQRILGNRPDLTLMGTKEAALNNADALIICTEWKMFRAPDFQMIKETLKNPVIFDGRNLFDPALLKSKGFTYYAIGRGDSVKQIAS